MCLIKGDGTMEEKEETKKATFDDTGMLDGKYYERLAIEAIEYVRKNKDKKKKKNKNVNKS